MIRCSVPRARSALFAVVLLAACLQYTDTLAACSIPTHTNSPAGSLPEHDNVLVGDIRIDNGDIFDLENPRYRGALHRVMNTLHIETAEDVIRRQLLFTEGDTVTGHDIAETERYLRENRFLADAEISMSSCTPGVVDVEVSTTDAWSLLPSISFSRKGGQNFGGFELQETNLLGSGSELKLAWDRDIERDRTELRYADRQLGNSRVGLLASAQDFDEGYRYILDVGQPFYALDVRRAAGTRIDAFDQVDPVFAAGERIADVRHVGRVFDARYGWSHGLDNGHVLRWTAGLGYDEHRFELRPTSLVDVALPSDRRDVYPFVGVEWLVDDFEEIRNQDQIARTEDRHMGTRLALELGIAPTVFGSSDNALRIRAAASRGFHPREQDAVMLSSTLDWRAAERGENSYRLDSGLRYYRKQDDKRLLFAGLNVTLAQNPDTDRLVTLGGETGLRGYPLRYLNGDAGALLTLEQRYFTDWYPLGLFRVGAAAFMDTGRVWASGNTRTASPGNYTDAGLGLRIGSPHSSTGRMLHLDLAYAMDGPPDVRGWQLYIESRKSF